MVMGHGYGGRDSHDLYASLKECAVFCPCARGFHLSAHPRFPENDCAKHVIHSLKTKEDYIIRGCVAELWGAATVLLNLFPEIGDNLFYSGGSFGGGLGALMLPWDKRYQRAVLGVPTFGHHPSRLQGLCHGSGEAVRQHILQNPGYRPILDYYDAAIAAKHIQIPVLVQPALFDPSVPPPGQFTVCNSIAGPKEYFIYSSGHFECPNAEAEGSAAHWCSVAFFNRD